MDLGEADGWSLSYPGKVTQEILEPHQRGKVPPPLLCSLSRLTHLQSPRQQDSGMFAGLEVVTTR